ncbi:aldo/keto reductase [Mahella australiensis]|uniref:Aldo/keto reductase n=1 Tax=Mahella australiensis (strain DSM 15567 / CIP 107919 / 50-1 BON) TaxID=697281 RepID=F4A147_MAHA5|nr:aldo/keto reductase [Mahella australiensis]AEE95950.1 aldo/keto reductase [Mahella australiensis 50-1 BON]
MQYRDFGNTGIKVSLLGFGAMRLPMINANGNDVVDEDKAIPLIHRAFELGVNYIDTAPGYCNKTSEIAVGKALKGWRDKVYLSTKNPIEDASGDNWRRRLEDSLKNLDVDYIDFYHMWGINWQTYIDSIDVPNGPMEAAHKAKKEGLIKHISFSFHDVPENMIKIIDTGNFESVLCQYNLLDRANEEAIAYARSKGLGVVIMGPVGGGRLGEPSSQIQNLLPGKAKSTAEMALRFVMANPNVSCALSGMSSIDMVEENVKVASLLGALNDKERQIIDQMLEENKRLADLYCTGCNYCMPCPTGVNIPLNFQVMNYHRVYGLTEYAKSQYARIGIDDNMSGGKAEDCTECGTCVPLCPQGLDIIKQLRETAEALG